MNKDRIIELADHIEKLPYCEIELASKNMPAFNMEHTHFDCGTPACLSGHTLALWAKGKESHNRAFELLGLTFEQCGQLFTPDLARAHYCSSRGYPGFITSKRAAKVLRRLADTGRVNWR